jgi:hypothetical protein
MEACHVFVFGEYVITVALSGCRIIGREVKTDCPTSHSSQSAEKGAPPLAQFHVMCKERQWDR